MRYLLATITITLSSMDGERAQMKGEECLVSPSLSSSLCFLKATLHSHE